MEKQTLDNLEAAIEAVGQELSGRVAELAAKSSSGTLSSDERLEHEQIVRLNDLGLTAEGRATVRLLDFNAEERLQLRRQLLSEGWRL